jgi:hypothetical protein
MIEIETMIGGHHCWARVTHYWAGDPGNISGPPEGCWPPEPPELDFEIIDKDGNRLRHLEKIMDDYEREDICDALMDAIDKYRKEEF